MEENSKYKSLAEKIFFLLFILLMSVPVSYNTYNFRKFSLNYRTETRAKQNFRQNKTIHLLSCLKKSPGFYCTFNLDKSHYISYINILTDVLFKENEIENSENPFNLKIHLTIVYPKENEPFVLV